MVREAFTGKELTKQHHLQLNAFSADLIGFQISSLRAPCSCVACTVPLAVSFPSDAHP